MKTRVLLLSVMMLFISSSLYSQFTKQQAMDTVLNHVIVSDTGHVNVFVANTSYASSDTLWLEDFEHITFTYTNSWVFFVNDHPFANWHHPCRYIAVSTVNGEYEIIPNTIYPANLDTGFELIHQINFTPHNTLNPLDGATTGKSPASATPNPNLYAVLITGWDDTKQFWNDISNIYCALTEVYGYKKDNIFVHYCNGETTTQNGKDLDGGEPSEDIDYSSHIDTLKKTFLNLGGVAGPLSDPSIQELSPEDQLFVFVNGHGSVYSEAYNGAFIGLPGTGFTNKLRDTTLANWLQHINCAQMMFVLSPCYAGGFIDDITDFENYQVQCENREIHTASELEQSYQEFWVTLDTTPSLSTVKFGEFVFYWTAAMRGYYPDFDEPWNVWEDFPVGTFPLEDFFPDSLNHFGDIEPDLNGDGIIQMGEAFLYADSLDSWSPYGFFAPNPYNSPGCDEHPDAGKTIAFQEDLLTLYGLSGEIESTQTVDGNFAIGGPLTVTNNATLTVSAGSEFYFINDVIAINGVDEDVIFNVEQNCGLSLGDNVKFYGFDTENLVKVNGNITFGNSNQFLSHTGNVWNGLSLNNQSATISISNATFEKANIYSDVSSLTVSNSSFEDCGTIVSDQGTIKFYNGCTFDNTGLDFENPAGDKSVTVDECDFINGTGKNAVSVKDYDRYNIRDNEISGFYRGVYLNQVGDGKPVMKLVEDNTISSCTYGIQTHGSNGIILNNQVSNCFRGVLTYDYSNMQLKGNSGAADETETQYIRDNSSYEVLASQYSFPSNFHYNIIEDNNNGSIPLVYHISSSSSLRDVTNNCWGSGFNGASDFYPSGYIYNPQWCPPGYKSGIVLSPEEEMYNYANELFLNESYSDAGEQYKLLIQQYPESEFAMNSLKELFALEQYVDNDYNALKTYYMTNTTVQSNDILTKVASHFVAKCNIELQNWQDAIDHFEYIILYPETFEDSVFAIIDLGYVYFAMENGGYKAAYTGNLAQHIPQTKSQFVENRDYLLSLLPGELKGIKQPESVASLNSGELMQNVPNPFKGETQIWYKLENESTVQLNVFNYTGQLIRTINEGTKTIGTHHIDFDASGLKNGIYFYSISINGQTSDSKKMTIMK